MGVVPIIYYYGPHLRHLSPLHMHAVINISIRQALALRSDFIGEDAPWSDSYDVNEEDVFSVATDDDGNPFINPDLHNLGIDHEKIRWVDAAHEDIVALYNHIISYRNDHANAHFLEKITFNRFLIFVAQNSYQHS